MENPIAIIGPMVEEITELKEKMDLRQEKQSAGMRLFLGKLFGKEVVLVHSGVGKVYAAMIAQHLIDLYHPKTILLTGVAGALNRHYEIGDLVIGKDYIQHDMNCEALGFQRGQIPFTRMRVFKANQIWLDAASTFSTRKHRLHVGRVLSGDQFFAEKDFISHAAMLENLQGDMIEMEAAAIAQVCLLNGDIPFLCLKTISDKADADAAVDFQQSLPVVVKNTTDMIAHLLLQQATI